MRIFITGATGTIGTAVTSAMIHAEHEVTALVRSSSDAGRLESAGVAVVRGDLRDLGALRDVIGAHDAVIHTALDGRDPANTDAAALDVLLTRGERPVVYTSGVWVFGNTGMRVVNEDSELRPLPIVAWRPGHEKRVLEGTRNAVVRPGCVYGGAQSLLAGWFRAVEADEPVEVIGDGLNRWAMVHQDDLADLYLKILETGSAGVFHGVDDTRATLDQMALALIEAVDSDSEIVNRTIESARKELGSLADALALDQHVSSETTRSRLAWQPSVSFVESVERQWEEWKLAK